MTRKRLVSTSEVGRLLDLSPRTITHFRRAGVLIPDVESPGGHARWDPAKVRAALDHHRQVRAERRIFEAILRASGLSPED